MTKVIHTGDTHLGYRQYHSPERRADFLDAFRQVVEDAVADDVDAVVHAGDLYHDRTPGLEDLMGTIEVLRPLADADIPFLAVVGNHEGTRHAQWLDLFETLGLAERLDFEGRRVGDTVFYGLDYVPESKRDALDYDFAEHDAAHAALVSHGLFQPFPHGDWDLETVLAESNVAFDAVLLGDDHTPDTVRLDGTWATYCGSTERASASERDPRGYNLVTFAAGDAEGAPDERTGAEASPNATGEGVTISRRGLDTRDFVFVDLELGESEGEERVRRRLREEAIEDAVVVVTIEGAGGEVTPADVERFGDERGALITRVNDRREVDVETEYDVSFADPDEAVRERVRALGLSEAARGIDAAVREGSIADSNVRDEVKDRIEDVVEEGDLAVFEAAADDDDDDDADDTGDDGDANDAGDDGDANDAGDDGDANDTGDDGDANDTADDDDGDAPPEASTEEVAADGPAAADAPTDTETTTMEDYL
ncbi:DNA repair exonuclease SbcCD nuclease subunit [Halarchaeum rubridurum]|uniref:DNA double-strand break repair protein Mre11 n=1 Tax=Halarchaeum rubridurum TaxID=489911 RepID=A0A830G2F3_9EURY|nr:DNA double-strand break repair protein Mre11 [Halarchaeum rubridurum]MBP1955369.1 DNA repair exonuclease SbcCD nuclease subunit [Halarchaeum rubridurum]GGM71840.1 metallophosphatase [Halarchaeum rubridurum]